MKKQIGMLAAVFALCASHAGATTLVFSDFSDVSTLQLNGSAARVGNVLRLTPAVTSQSGTAFSLSPITLSGAYSFSTFFSFRISSIAGTFGDSDGPGADGITFIVQTNSNTAGSAGGGIGYQGIPNSAAVEYDTYFNGGIDPNGNHVGIDLGGNITSVATAVVSPRLNDSQVWFSWIDYNGTTGVMDVRLSLTNARPAAALLSSTFNLGTQLGTTSAFVGFGSGTGAGFGNHDILSWEFRDTFAPIDNGSEVPEPGTLSLLGLGSLALAKLRRRRA
jgi:legume-like lectin family protein/PEP-CTERM motif-containing protein